MKQRIKSFLQSYEQRSDVDALNIVKGSAFLTFVNGFNAICSLGMAVVYANLLTAETFGTYRYLLSLVGILTAFALTGMNAAVTRAVAQGKEGSFLFAVRTQLIAGLIQTSVALSIGAYYYFQGNWGFALFLFGAAIASPVSNAYNTYQSFLLGKKEYKSLSWSFILLTVATYGATLVSILLKRPAYEIALSNVTAGMIANIAFHFWLKRTHPIGTETDPNTLRLGIKFSISNTIQMLAAQLDNILIFQFLGSAQLAAFAFITLVPERARGYLKIIAMSAAPGFSHPKSARAKYGKGFAFVALLYAVIALAFILLVPWAFRLVFPAYTNVIVQTQVYALSIILAVSLLPVTYLSSQGKDKEIQQQSVLISVVQIVSTCIFVPLYGLWGAIGARLFTQCIGLLNAVYLFNKIRNNHVQDGK